MDSNLKNWHCAEAAGAAAQHMGAHPLPIGENTYSPGGLDLTSCVAIPLWRLKCFLHRRRQAYLVAPSAAHMAHSVNDGVNGFFLSSTIYKLWFRYNLLLMIWNCIDFKCMKLEPWPCVMESSDNFFIFQKLFWIIFKTYRWFTKKWP